MVIWWSFINVMSFVGHGPFCGWPWNETILSSASIPGFVPGDNKLIDAAILPSRLQNTGIYTISGIFGSHSPFRLLRGSMYDVFICVFIKERKTWKRERRGKSDGQTNTAIKAEVASLSHIIWKLNRSRCTDFWVWFPKVSIVLSFSLLSLQRSKQNGSDRHSQIWICRAVKRFSKGRKWKVKQEKTPKNLNRPIIKTLSCITQILCAGLALHCKIKF